MTQTKLFLCNVLQSEFACERTINFAATFRISNYLTFTGKENCDREFTENPQNNP